MGTWWPIGGVLNAGSPVTFALSSAFSWVAAGSVSNAGRGVCFPFITEAAGTITDIWINVSSFTGTWGSTDGVVQVAVHNGSTSARSPGDRVAAPENLTLTSGTLGWYKLHLATPLGLSAYTAYSVVVSDTDGGGTNFVTLNISGGDLFGGAAIPNTTTAGWASNAAGTASGNCPLCSFKLGGVMYGSLPLTVQATTTSDTLSVGNVYQFEENMDIIAVGAHVDPGALGGNTVKLYKSTVVPSGTPDATWAIGAANLMTTDYRGVPLAPFTLTAGVKYYLVVAKAGAQTTPRILTAAAGLDADLKTLFPLQGSCYRVIKTAAGTDTWTEDTTALMQLWAMFRPSNSAGGGGNLNLISSGSGLVG